MSLVADMGISRKQPADNPLIRGRSLFRQTRPPLPIADRETLRPAEASGRITFCAASRANVARHRQCMPSQKKRGGFWTPIDNRRLAEDFEHMVESPTAWLVIASVQLLTRRTARV